LVTSSDGSYETIFANLSVGSYTVNVSAVYNNLPSSCTDNLQIGSSAVFVLSKIANIHNVSNNTINYNITLILSNSGGVAALNSNITDSDSLNSPYNLGNVLANSTAIVSYIKNFTRQGSTTYYLLTNAVAIGIDSYSGNMISANSSTINITIPAISQGINIVIIKNVVFVSENSTVVIYNVSSTLYNAGDLDLTDVSYIDTDIQGSSILVNLTVGQSRQFSNLKTIAKAASNTQHQFALGTAVVGTQSFYSNQPTVNIPGYGGPADVIVYAPTQVNSGASFDSFIEVRNINPDIGQDFIVDYWITSQDESVNYSSGQQTIFVSANGSANLTATLTAPSSAGTYKLRALVTWVGGTASSFDSFEVVVAAQPPGGGGGGGGTTAQVVKEPEVETPAAPSGELCALPFVRIEGKCCADINLNRKCDIDEIEIPQPAPQPRTGRFLTGLFIFDNFELFSRIFVFIFIIVFLLLVFLVKYALKKNRVKEKGLMRISWLIGMKVYTSDGFEIGKVETVMLFGNRIDSLGVKILKKYKIKGIVINYKSVEAVSDIVLVKKEVLNGIGKNIQ
jgi:sporulation protein YlmC with PRC-barrel domain